MVGNLKTRRPMTSHTQPASVRCAGDIMRKSRESLTGFEKGPQISRGNKELENLWLERKDPGMGQVAQNFYQHRRTEDPCIPTSVSRYGWGRKEKKNNRVENCHWLNINRKSVIQTVKMDMDPSILSQRAVL